MRFLLFPLFAGVAAGALTYGAATFVLEEPAEAPPAADAPAPAVAKGEPVAAADAPAPDAAAPAPAPESLTPEPPPRPARPQVLKQWTLPGQAREGVDGYRDLRAHTLAVNAFGTRVVTVSKTEAHCWDAATGRRLQTYRADKGEIVVSPDARFVALVKRDGSEVTVRAADSGAVVGSHRVAARSTVFIDHTPPAFTPGGDYLLLAAKNGTQHVLHAVATRTGTAHLVPVPGWGKDHPLYDALLPVPGRPVLLFALGRRGAQKTASGVVAVDLRGRGETPVSGLTFQPWVLFQDRGIQVSADGRLVLARHQNGLQICEWETNRRLLELTGSTNSFGGAWFTPDAKRCLVLRSPHGAVPPGGGSEKLAATFELYDIAAKRMIAECPPDDFDLTGVSAVAFSQDGKTVAIADRLAAVKLFDFESAFHVPPLPPVKPTWETDPLR